MIFLHTPVMLKEALEYLKIQENGIYVDATLGGGGYTQEILKGLGNAGKLISIDRDLEAVKNAVTLFENEKRISVVRGNFTQISQILKEKNIEEIDGIVFDLGVSSNQLEQAERGFSFMHNARLDMRMDSRERTDAQELVNELSESELEKILRDYGQEWFSARIARNIVKQREIKRIETTEELVNIVKRSVPRHKWPKRVNVATKTFQAIRIKVNDEIENLRKALEDSVGLMRKNARIVVVSYHSLEDKTVKRFFKEKSSGDEKTIEVLTKKPLEPDEEEVALNNRSRSAKLRAARKL